jgi:hypothetical protein
MPKKPETNVLGWAARVSQETKRKKERKKRKKREKRKVKLQQGNKFIQWDENQGRNRKYSDGAAVVLVSDLNHLPDAVL